MDIVFISGPNVGKQCSGPLGKYWLCWLYELNYQWSLIRPKAYDFACHSDWMWHAFTLNTYNALSWQCSTTKCFQADVRLRWTYFKDGITSKLTVTSTHGCLCGWWFDNWWFLCTRYKWVWLRLLWGWITRSFSCRNQKSKSVMLQERRYTPEIQYQPGYIWRQSSVWTIKAMPDLLFCLEQTVKPLTKRVHFQKHSGSEFHS